MPSKGWRKPLRDRFFEKVALSARALGAKLMELRSATVAANLPEPVTLSCPLCGIKTKGPRTLSEHLYLSHDAEVPETWERAEQIAE